MWSLFSSPRLSFFSGSAKTPKPGNPAPFQMNAYVSVTMREVSTEASYRNSIITLCATKVLVCANPRDCFFNLLERSTWRRDPPHVCICREWKRKWGKSTTEKHASLLAVSTSFLHLNLKNCKNKKNVRTIGQWIATQQPMWNMQQLR